MKQIKHLQEYWRSIRKLQHEFEVSHPDGVYMATVGSADAGVPAGVVTICRPELAARLVIDGTHEIASEDRVARFKAEQERDGKLIRAEERGWIRQRRDPNKKGVNYEL